MTTKPPQQKKSHSRITSFKLPIDPSGKFNWKQYADDMLGATAEVKRQADSFIKANEILDSYYKQDWNQFIYLVARIPITPDILTYIIDIVEFTVPKKRGQKGGKLASQRNPLLDVKQRILDLYVEHVIEHDGAGRPKKYKFKNDFIGDAIERFGITQEGVSIPSSKTISDWLDESGYSLPLYWTSRSKTEFEAIEDHKIKIKILALYVKNVINNDQMSKPPIYKFLRRFVEDALDKFQIKDRGKPTPSAKTISNWLDDSALPRPIYWRPRKKE